MLKPNASEIKNTQETLKCPKKKKNKIIALQKTVQIAEALTRKF